MRKRLTMLATGAVVLGLSGYSAKAADPVSDVPGPIDNLQDLQDSGKMIFKIADANNDGQISQREAVDAGNLVVGGFFFRADANGDGTLSRDEFRQAQESFLAQRPLARWIVERAKQPNATSGGATPNANVAQGFMAVVDSNGDGQIQSAELRQAVQTAVQSVYATADTNRDGQLNPSEVNAATVGAIRAVAQAIFDTVDTDHNGQLSQAEYDKAITVPANALFKILDANNDGQISPQEAQSAQRILTSQIRMLQVPEPANSAKNLLQSGARPEQVAPVPDFKNAAPAQNAQPAPAPAPAAAPTPAPRPAQ